MTEKDELTKRFDWILLIVCGLLTFLGFLMIWSATIKTGNPEFYFGKQVTAFSISLISIFIIIGIRYKIFKGYTYYLYFFTILLLILVLLFGSRIHGSKSWFTFFGFSFQPSEFAKISVILILASYIDENYRRMTELSVLIEPFIFVGSIVALILLQPDFSSSIVFIPILFGMLYIGGARISHLFCFFLYGSIAGGIPLLTKFLVLKYPTSVMLKIMGNILYLTIAILCLYLFIGIVFWLLKNLKFRMTIKQLFILYFVIFAGVISSVAIEKFFKDYQKKRLIVFLDPQIDPLGSGYNIIQSEIAIGSGRVIGKGLFSGTQNQLGFVPAQHTDFIFTVAGEELGILFLTAVLFLYFILCLRGIRIMQNASDKFGSFIAGGIVFMFVFYIFLNIGMVSGIMPITGVPLPFLSYGGSSLITSLIAIGVLLNIHIRRFAN